MAHRVREENAGGGLLRGRDFFLAVPGVFCGGGGNT